ncbi:hypothetical protein [Pseudomonas viridiflava]|uniref:hypothetical protein n=1 Tax=Pseudomonas viridiflava TaxID=33069 RepID=UPI000F03B5FB|nr:hypothetical protein [Pseudomonas viridiflava]
MKKVLLFIVAGFLAANGAYASSNVGKCVFPKTKTLPNGNLSFVHAIGISDLPSPQAAVKPLVSMEAYQISAEEKGFIKLVTVPDYSLADPQVNAGKIVGWGKIRDFDLQAQRNCN